MSFTAKQIEEALDTLREDEDFDYYELEEDSVELPNIGKTEAIDNYGGEGQGDERWIVFKVGDQLFRLNGYYSSYDGSTWDGGVEEVEAYEKTVTDYRVINNG